MVTLHFGKPSFTYDELNQDTQRMLWNGWVTLSILQPMLRHRPTRGINRDGG